MTRLNVALPAKLVGSTTWGVFTFLSNDLIYIPAGEAGVKRCPKRQDPGSVAPMGQCKFLIYDV
jgi:hypothetical protein